MGILICNNCKATAEADSFEEADEQIDHGLGVRRGKGCPANDLDLTWNGDPVAEIVYRIGPGSANYRAPRRKQVRSEEPKSDAKPSPPTSKKSGDSEKSKSSEKSTKEKSTEK